MKSFRNTLFTLSAVITLSSVTGCSKTPKFEIDGLKLNGFETAKAIGVAYAKNRSKRVQKSNNLKRANDRSYYCPSLALEDLNGDVSFATFSSGNIVKSLEGWRLTDFYDYSKYSIVVFSYISDNYGEDILCKTNDNLSFDSYHHLISHDYIKSFVLNKENGVIYDFRKMMDRWIDPEATVADDSSIIIPSMEENYFYYACSGYSKLNRVTVTEDGLQEEPFADLLDLHNADPFVYGEETPYAGLREGAGWLVRTDKFENTYFINPETDCYKLMNKDGEVSDLRETDGWPSNNFTVYFDRILDVYCFTFEKSEGKIRGYFDSDLVFHEVSIDVAGYENHLFPTRRYSSSKAEFIGGDSIYIDCLTNSMGRDSENEHVEADIIFSDNGYSLVNIQSYIYGWGETGFVNNYYTDYETLHIQNTLTGKTRNVRIPKADYMANIDFRFDLNRLEINYTDGSKSYLDETTYKIIEEIPEPETFVVADMYEIAQD